MRVNEYTDILLKMLLREMNGMRRLATQKDQVAQGYMADFNTVFCYEA